MLQDGFHVSERKACRLVGQPRGTQRYLPTQATDEDALTRAIVALAATAGAIRHTAAACRHRVHAEQ